MASTYIGKAPLTLVPTVDGTAHYVYRGRPAPEGIVPDALERFLDEGFLEEAAGSFEDAVATFVHPDPVIEAGLMQPRPSLLDQVAGVEERAAAIAGTPQVGGVVPPDGTGEPEVVVPPKTANKAMWVDFRVGQLREHGEQHRESLEKLTKEELQDDVRVAAALQPHQS